MCGIQNELDYANRKYQTNKMNKKEKKHTLFTNIVLILHQVHLKSCRSRRHFLTFTFLNKSTATTLVIKEHFNMRKTINSKTTVSFS